MSAKPKPEPKKRVVLDTSVWLVACASKQLGDKMSELDIQLREKSLTGNPDKFRGVLVNALINKAVIVPETVLQELKGQASAGMAGAGNVSGRRPKLNEDNIRNIRALTAALENRTTKVPVTREAVALQKEVWDEIRRTADSSPEQKKLWEKKFEPHYGQVKEECRKAEETQLEPWLHAKARAEELRMASLKNPSEKTRKEIDRLKRLVEETEPHLVPDFEIMLTAIAAKAELISFDKDFAAMWKALPECIKEINPESVPKVGARLNDTAVSAATPNDLAKEVEGKARRFSSKETPTWGIK